MKSNFGIEKIMIFYILINMNIEENSFVRPAHLGQNEGTQVDAYPDELRFRKPKIGELPGLGSRQIFFPAPAPAPDFFVNRLRLLIFFPKRLRLRLLFFFQAAPAPAPRSQKHPAPTSSGSWLLVKFAKIFFSPQTSKVKRQKNIKQVK